MTVIIVTCKTDDDFYPFGVFESKEKYLQEIKPHLEMKGIKAPLDWARIEVGLKTLYAEETEMNAFLDWI